MTVLALTWALALPLSARAEEGEITLQSARAHLEQGDYGLALDEARELLYDEPRNAAALYIAGVAASNLDRLSDAEKYLDKAKRADPEAPDVDYQLGVVLLKIADELFARGKDKIAIGLCEEALQHIESELARSPDHAQAVSLRAGAYRKAGRGQDATAAYEAWASAEPDNPTIRAELIRLYVDQSKVEDARKLLPDLPQGTEQRAAATFLVARADYIEGRAAEGRVLLEQLRGLPAEPWQLLALDALDALDRGEGHEAAAALAKLLGADPPQEDVAIVVSAYHAQYSDLWRSEASAGAGDAAGEEPRDVDSLPKLQMRIAPTYPGDALRYGVHGDVLLLAVIQEDGSVGKLSVISSNVTRHASLYGAQFEEAAIQAVKQWRYAPARRDGEAVAFPITIHLQFSQ